MIGSTAVNISWQQDEDVCNQSITPLFLINSLNSVPADCKPTELSNFECFIYDLTPDTKYTLDVYITTKDGRRSATAVSTTFETGVR